MGWKQEEDKWKWFDENGNQITGWFKCPSDNSYYFLCSDDVMTGFLLDDDDRYYYLSPCQQVIDGKQYYKGQLVCGWLTYNEKQCYLYDGSRPDLGIYRGQCLVDGTYEMPYDKNKKYTFDKDGYLVENVSSISDKLVEGSKCFEGYYSYWYTGDGTNTIGFGTSTAGTVGARIYNSGIKSCTVEQATEWFKEEMKNGCSTLTNWLKSNNITLNQNQFDACADAIYNMGFGNFKKFGLADIILGNKPSTLENWCVCITDCNGVKYQGLITRRKFEYEIYNNNNYSIRP